jgi:hypothetical protein
VRLLIAYHRKGAWPTQFLQEFDDSDTTAVAAWWAATGHHDNDPDVEVVLLSADSRATMERTHGKYFR